MNREEYLEILKDYLKQRLSPVECCEIERDIQELILDGIQKGKTEQEILDGLGSPKNLATNLLLESLEPGTFSIHDSWKERIKRLFHAGKRCLLKVSHAFTHSSNHTSSADAPAPVESQRLPSRFKSLWILAGGLALILFLIVCVPVIASTLLGILLFGFLLAVCVLLSPAILLCIWFAVAALLIAGTVVYGMGIVSVYQICQYLNLTPLHTFVLLLESTLLYIVCVCLNLFLQKIFYSIFKFMILQIKNACTRMKLRKVSQTASSEDCNQEVSQ